MKRVADWWKGPAGLAVVVALALAFAWLLRAAGRETPAGQAAGPQATTVVQDAGPMATALAEKNPVSLTAAVLTATVAPTTTVPAEESPVPTMTVEPTTSVMPSTPLEAGGMIRIVYAVQPPGKVVTLWVLDYEQPTDTVTLRELTTSPYESAAYLRVYGFSVSSDGKHAALNLRGGAENLDYAVWTLQTDGTWLNEFQTLKTSPPMFWDWMPDGKKMLVGERDGNATGVLDAEDGTFVEFPLIRDEDFYFTVIGGAVSPAGQGIAFSINGANEIWRASLAGNSLDGNSLVKAQIPKRELGGSFAQRLTWSPDGKKLAYFELLETEMSEVQVMDIADNSVTFVSSDDAHNLDPVWSPDGTALVYVREGTPGIIPWIGGFWDNWNSSIWLAEVESARYYELVPSEGKACWSADWLPDGSGVVFISNRKGESDIWIVNRDGTGLRRLTDQGDIVALDIMP